MGGTCQPRGYWGDPYVLDSMKAWRSSARIRCLALVFPSSTTRIWPLFTSWYMKVRPMPKTSAALAIGYRRTVSVMRLLVQLTSQVQLPEYLDVEQSPAAVNNQTAARLLYGHKLRYVQYQELEQAMRWTFRFALIRHVQLNRWPSRGCSKFQT